MPTPALPIEFSPPPSSASACCASSDVRPASLKLAHAQALVAVGVGGCQFACLQRSALVSVKFRKRRASQITLAAGLVAAAAATLVAAAATTLVAAAFAAGLSATDAGAVSPLIALMSLSSKLSSSKAFSKSLY